MRAETDFEVMYLLAYEASFFDRDIIPFASWVSEYIYVASLSC